MQGSTILYSEMTPDDDWEDRFNKWYDTHHIPVRMDAPGFISARRYRESDKPNYLAVYEMDAPGALETPEYLGIKNHPNTETRWMLENVSGFSRYLCAEINDVRRDDAPADLLDAPVLFAVFFSVPDERADEFNAWYDDEHVPLLLKGKDWLGCRRFDIYDGDPEPWTHLALHYLASMDALDTEERAAARDTDWRKKLAEEDWFRGSYRFFDAYGERFKAT